MLFRVLGPVQVVDASGTLVHVPGVKERWLLALLLAHVNDVVASEQLAEQLWEGHPPRSAVKSLQAHVVRLRSALEPHRPRGSPGTMILTQSPGYVLRASAEYVDACRFRALKDEGRQALHAGSYETAASTLRDALGLWRGSAYAGLTCELVAEERRRLELEREDATEDRIDADLGRGLAGVLVAELEELVASAPWRERRWGQLMLALFRADRQAEALTAYDRVRRVLADDLGVDPGPALRDLHARVLAQDEELLHRTSRAVGASLPAALDPRDGLFVGRQEILRSLLSWWGDVAVDAVWVVGEAGLGKTRLCAEFARLVHDDQVPVVYASAEPRTADPLAVLHRLLAQVGTTPSEVAGSITDAHGVGMAVGTRLGRLAGEHGLLVVLDDLDGDGAVFSEAMDALRRGIGGSGVRLVLVARQPGIHPTARVVQVGPLGTDGVGRIVARYVGDGEASLLAADLAVRTGGIPARIHEEAARQARSRAERAVREAAEQVAAGRAAVLNARDRLIDGVAVLDDVATSTTVGRNRDPYKGLARFEVSDADLYFGREDLLCSLVARLAVTPLIALVGPSGSGKSSLARAGLVAALSRGVLPGSASWAVADVTPGAHPMDALRVACPAGVNARADQESAAGSRLVLLVDQFEEVVTACSDEQERSTLFDSVYDLAARDDGAGAVILTVRAEFLSASTTAHPGLRTLVADGIELVGPMDSADLARAVELPARRVGVTVEPALTTAIVTDVANSPGGLPLLSTALVELWEQRQGDALALEDYRALGGVRSAVARLAESVWVGLDENQRDCARRILIRLAGEGHAGEVVRRRIPLSELEGQGDTERLVLDRLTERRILLMSTGTGGQFVEVSHEALLTEWPRLRDWLEEDKSGRRVHRHLTEAAREWQAAGRDDAELYRGTRLVAALEWAAADPAAPNQAERSFLNASRDRALRETQDARRQAVVAQRRARRLRLALVGVVLLLLVSAGATVVALDQRITAEQRAASAERAQTRARAAAVRAQAVHLGSAALAQNGLDRSLLLAVAAYRLDHSADTRSTLLSSVLRSSAAVDVTRFEPTQRVLSLAASSSGGLMAAGLDDGRVVFWRPGNRTQSQSIRLNRGAPVFEAQFSPDNTRLAVIAGDATYVLRSSDGSVLRRFAARTRDYAIALDWVSSRRLQVASSRGTVFALDPRTGREVDLVGTAAVGGKNPQSAALDGARIATTHEAGTLAVADAATSIGRVDETGGAKVFGFSPDGALITSDNTTDVVLRDPGSLRVVERLEQHAARVTAAIASPAGHYLASGDADGLTMVWDLRSGQLVETLEGHSVRVSGLAFSPDGGTLTSSSYDGTAITWDLTGRQRFGHLVPASRLTPLRAPVLADADVVHPGRFRRPGVGDGAQIVSTRLDIRRPLVRRAGIGPLTSVRVSPDRRAIFVGGRAGEVVGLDARTGRLMGDRLDLARPVRTIELAPGGDRLAVGTATGVTVVDAANMQRQARVDTPAAVDSVAFSPDGHRLAIGRHDGVVTIGSWEGSQRPVRVAPVGLGWPAIALGWTADGRSIAVGTLGGTVHVADTATGRRTGQTISAHSGYVLSVDVSADGSMLLTAGSDGSASLWDFKTHTRIGGPMVVGPREWSFASFLRHDSAAGTVSAAPTQRVWPTTPAAWMRRACSVANRDLTHIERAEFGVPPNLSVCP